jgi:hypothetical protein
VVILHQIRRFALKGLYMFLSIVMTDHVQVPKQHFIYLAKARFNAPSRIKSHGLNFWLPHTYTYTCSETAWISKGTFTPATLSNPGYWQASSCFTFQNQAYQ